MSMISSENRLTAPGGTLLQIRTIAYYTVLEALRNRLLWLALLVVGLCLGLAAFLQQVAVTESREIQSSFVAALLRLSAVFIVCAFIITSMVREYNDKGLELFLALPMPRASYFFGKLAGFGACAGLLAALFCLPLLLYAPPAAVALWGLSLVCELAIMSAMSLFCVITLTQILPAMSAVLAFYLLSRSVAALQLIGLGPLIEPGFSQKTANLIINGIAALLPRLDTFTQTSWLVYAEARWPDLAPIAVQALVYGLLLCGAALFDLYRKNL